MSTNDGSDFTSAICIPVERLFISFKFYSYLFQQIFHCIPSIAWRHPNSPRRPFFLAFDVGLDGFGGLVSCRTGEGAGGEAGRSFMRPSAPSDDRSPKAVSSNSPVLSSAVRMASGGAEETSSEAGVDGTSPSSIGSSTSTCRFSLSEGPVTADSERRSLARVASTSSCASSSSSAAAAAFTSTKVCKIDSTETLCDLLHDKNTKNNKKLKREIIANRLSNKIEPSLHFQNIVSCILLLVSVNLDLILLAFHNRSIRLLGRFAMLGNNI